MYESPHRLLKTLQDIYEVLDNPRVVCVRELTKKFEEVRPGTCQDLIGHFTRNSPKGEFVLLLSRDGPVRGFTAPLDRSGRRWYI